MTQCNVESVLSILCAEAVLTVLLQFCNWPVGNLYETCNTKLCNCPPALLTPQPVTALARGGGRGGGRARLAGGTLLFILLLQMQQKYLLVSTVPRVITNK